MDLQERWERVEEVFHAALSQEPSRRDDFLSRTCAADPDLLAEVRSLISAHEQSGSFINTPAYELMADRLVESDSQAYLGQTLGHYTILAHLGRGGMGDVYLAQDSRLDRKVALKVLAAPSPEGGAVLLRFMTEAKAASSLNHPNIITIYDAGQEGASHYIATELIDGQTLRHKMQATRLGLHEALQIAIQVAGALAEAHAAGIVHRDVKPENIMIRRDGLVKVLDFGLATHRTIAPAGIATRAEPLPARDSATDTLAGTIMGTINYMSPEQARGEAVDGRSDVFSLGVVLYEMTTGRRPFEGETDLEAIQSIAEFDPFPVAGMDTEIEHVLRTALSKDTRLRYQTSADFLFDLKKLAEGFKGPGSHTVAAKRGRGNWPFHLSAKGLASSFLLLVGVLFVFWLSHGNNRMPMAQPLANPKIALVASWRNGLGADTYGASFSPDGRTIAFSSTKAGQPNIWTKELDSSDPLPITQTPSEYVRDVFPIWSPDGQEIAFASDRSNAVGIWRVNASGGPPNLLARLPDGAEMPRLVYWSQNSTGIYFERSRNLFFLELASRQVTQITTFDPLNSRAGSFSIAPGGDRVLYSDVGGGRDGIWAFKIDDPRPLQVTGEGTGHMGPVWMSGNRIAFSAEVEGTHQIFIGSMDGAKPRQISPGDASHDILAASAGGDKLLVSSLREESDLWKVVIANEDEAQVTWESGVELWPSPSPDGGRLLFQVIDDPGGGMKLLHSRLICKPLAGPGRQITLAPDAYDAKWSPKGDKVAFIRDLRGTSNIFIVDPDGGHERQLTLKDMIYTPFTYKPYNRGQSYEWSPDGSRIAYSALRSKVSNIYSISTDGSDERDISGNSNPALSFSCVFWSPDGEKLAFTSTDAIDKSGKRLSAVWVSNGRSPEMVYQSYFPLSLVGWSQTGGELIVAVQTEHGFVQVLQPAITLIRLSLKTNSVRTLARLKSAYPLNIRLSPNRTSIAFACHCDGADNIWIVPAAGGRPKRVTDNPDPRQYISGLEWSPDSQVLFYGKQTDRTRLSLFERF